MVYLALDYGCYEGWRLIEYLTPEQALEAVKRGEYSGSPWKILRELPVVVQDGNDSIYKPY